MRNSKQKGLFRTLLVPIVACSIAASTATYFFKDDFTEVITEKADQTMEAYSSNRLTSILGGVQDRINDDPNTATDSYRITADFVKSNMDKYPHVANELIRKGYDTLDSNQLENSTLESSLNYVRGEIEKNPELMKKLGPNAHEYMVSVVLDEYQDKLKENYDGFLKGVSQKSKSFIEFLDESKDSLIKYFNEKN